MPERNTEQKTAAQNAQDAAENGLTVGRLNTPISASSGNTGAEPGSGEPTKSSEPSQDTLSEESDDKSSKRPVDILLGLAKNAALFHTDDGTAYADVCVNGARATLAVMSDPFGKWLTQLYLEETSTAPRPDALKDAQSTLSAKAQYQAPLNKVYRRTALRAGKVYIDLGDAAWRAVEIDVGGWRVIAAPPVRYIRSSASRALPVPLQGGSIDPLRNILNLRDGGDFVLVISWVLTTLASDGPFPILVINGEQGSSKSTFSTIIRSLVDPNAAPVRSMSRNEQELFVASQHSRVLAFDNLSGITPSMSDALCRVATGGAFAARKLYSDGDEVLLTAKNPILLNGIAGTVTRADLADRSMFVKLMPIPDEKRRPIAEVQREFEATHPAIFGALLDAVSEGLRRIDTVALPHPPRMADFARWATACETALWPEGTFQQAYTKNVDAAVDDMIDDDPVASALRDLMHISDHWEGTASELLSALSATAGTHASARSHDWPKTPRALSECLKRSETVLRKIGIRIERRKEGKSRDRILLISRSGRSIADPEISKVPSASSASSATAENANGSNEITAEAWRAQTNEADAAAALSATTVRRKHLKTNEADGADGIERFACRPNGVPQAKV
jgi:hypothetical protein